jgi:putative ATPase
MDISMPLAERMRAQDWEEYVGQLHIVGEASVLRRALEKNEVPSMVFWGPPGSGKTTLARLIAKKVDTEFVQFSAVSSGVKQVREVVEIARQRKQINGKRTILFVDEVHRFSKSQQDAFLPHIEDGTIIFIGATTENPSFEINAALLSRSRVFVLDALTEEYLVALIDAALKDREKGLGRFQVKFEKGTKELLAQLSNGDARVALNTLEFMVFAKQHEKKITLNDQDVYDAMQKMPLLYDRAGDEHYNTISAFIKSMRAGAVDAAVYYLARMIEAGEDPLFIARRMVIFASEDIGMAQPTALVVANEVFSACQVIGYPECAINLAHGVVYLASAKKDRRAYDALRAAQADIRETGNLPIPKTILNAPTTLMKNLNYGKGYEQYPEDKSKLLPEKLRNRKYFR